MNLIFFRKLLFCCFYEEPGTLPGKSMSSDDCYVVFIPSPSRGPPARTLHWRCWTLPRRRGTCNPPWRAGQVPHGFVDRELSFIFAGEYFVVSIIIIQWASKLSNVFELSFYDSMELNRWNLRYTCISISGHHLLCL